MQSKKNRQFKIKEIISSMDIANQEELLSELKKQKIETAQATLSRDLNELGIIRIPTENGFKYSFSKDDLSLALKNVIGLEILSLVSNETTIVVKTLPGRAQGVAVFFDRLEKSHIIGTVAGDDTIILIPDSVKNISQIIKHIEKLMSGKGVK
ncbi:MAG: arginine repressor [Calditrichaeota bacterium]|nr:arginine repressor [Calditrichota bacterium]